MNWRRHLAGSMLFSTYSLDGSVVASDRFDPVVQGPHLTLVTPYLFSVAKLVWSALEGEEYSLSGGYRWHTAGSELRGENVTSACGI